MSVKSVSRLGFYIFKKYSCFLTYTLNLNSYCLLLYPLIAVSQRFRV